jgi:hypothetical protein
MLVTTGSMMAFSNAGIGFLAGLVVAALLSVQRLGLRDWCHHTWRGILDIPQKWRSQRDYSTGRMLPTSAPTPSDASTDHSTTKPNTDHQENQHLSSSSTVSLPHQPVPHTSTSS